MALQFSETAPGVHTSSILNPRTDKRHNIAIIESCDVWQLFIDGELAVCDLPSFKAALAQAEAKFAPPRTSNMVRAACVLVVLSMAGASTIGLTKVLAPVFSAETAVAAIASSHEDRGITHRFARVKPAAAKSGPPPQANDTAKPSVVVEEAVVAVSGAGTDRAAAGSKTPATATGAYSRVTAPAELPAAQPAAVQPSTVVRDAEVEAAVSAVPVLGLNPIVPRASSRSTTDPRAVGITPQPAAPTPAPVVINARSQPTQSSVGLPESRAPGPAEESTSPQPVDLETGDPEVAAIAPPLPNKAPVRAVPVIRSAGQPIAPERLTSILAELEVEAKEPVTRAVGQRKTERRTLKRRAAKRRARSTNRHGGRRASRRSLRHAHRHGPAYSGAPGRRMVCLGHVCRFR